MNEAGQTKKTNALEKIASIHKALKVVSESSSGMDEIDTGHQEVK
jgi:hypothetical protein